MYVYGVLVEGFSQEKNALRQTILICIFTTTNVYSTGLTLYLPGDWKPPRRRQSYRKKESVSRVVPGL